MKKPKILITNDDGIHAAGIKSLWKALHPIADLAIMAPDSEKSASGLALTLGLPLTVVEVKWPENTPAWAVNGTPADCVKLALSTHIDFVPDLVVSGINHGSNAGRNALYSGTVACVIEAVMQNVPGIAFSCFSFENPEYYLAEPFIPKIVEYVLKNPLGKGTLLNVNFPYTAGQPPRGIKFTRQGTGMWVENPDKRTHPEGHTYYWIGMKKIDGKEDDSDTHWIEKGYVTAVPIHIAELTDHRVIEERKTSFEQLFAENSNNHQVATQK